LKRISLVIAMLFSNAKVFAVEASIQQIQAVFFGSVVTRAGSCEIDPISGDISSPENICIGSETLGHYRISGNASEMQVIKFNQVTDSSRGLHFAPKARLVNNLGDDMQAPIAGVETYIRLGSDGIIDIYLGGTLTFSQAQNSNSPIVIFYDIDFSTP
jgi:hypothetical protein